VIDPLETFDVVVIGAGFCGLGAGAALRKRGIERFAILEQGDRAGYFWSRTYDRLHLHSAFHDLPDDGGLRRGYPTFLARDQVVEYFARYAERHGLAPHFRFGTKVARVKRVETPAPGGPEWQLETSRGRIGARFLAVGTAVNRAPVVPAISGRETFRGRVLHSAEYRNAAPFAGRSVLVVGSGNSAAEIALDLVEGGARSVAMWVRGPRHFIPLRRMARVFWTFRLLGFFGEKRAAAAHAITYGSPEFERTIAQRDKLTRFLSVDLSKYGIRKPEAGPMWETFYAGRIPTFDQGAIEKIRSGAIRIVDGNLRPIEAFTEEGVRFGDGVERFDDVILATGFEPRLEEFMADPEVLGPVQHWKSFPLTDGRARSRVYRSLFFPGFDRTPLGGQSLGRWGWEVGERIAEELAPGR
jgi:indole-3-pyruvate monooxygenase